MRMDPKAVDNADVGERVGEFFGTAIHSLDHDAVELRAILDARERVFMNTKMGGVDIPIELLPGETLTRGSKLGNNIIRRETTVEAREAL